MANLIEVALPDIGDYKDVPVGEINVAVGDDVMIDTTLLSIESEKATMEVPSPAAGRVKQLKTGVGSLVSQGTILMILDTGSVAIETPPKKNTHDPPPATRECKSVLYEVAARSLIQPEAEPRAPKPETGGGHALPSVRVLARELGGA